MILLPDHNSSESTKENMGGENSHPSRKTAHSSAEGQSKKKNYSADTRTPPVDMNTKHVASSTDVAEKENVFDAGGTSNQLFSTDSLNKRVESETDVRGMKQEISEDLSQRFQSLTIHTPLKQVTVERLKNDSSNEVEDEDPKAIERSPVIARCPPDAVRVRSEQEVGGDYILIEGLRHKRGAPHPTLWDNDYLNQEDTRDVPKGFKPSPGFDGSHADYVNASQMNVALAAPRRVAVEGTDPSIAQAEIYYNSGPILQEQQRNMFHRPNLDDHTQQPIAQPRNTNYGEDCYVNANFMQGMLASQQHPYAMPSYLNGFRATQDLAQTITYSSSHHTILNDNVVPSYAVGHQQWHAHPSTTNGIPNVAAFVGNHQVLNDPHGSETSPSVSSLMSPSASTVGGASPVPSNSSTYSPPEHRSMYSPQSSSSYNYLDKSYIEDAESIFKGISDKSTDPFHDDEHEPGLSPTEPSFPVSHMQALPHVSQANAGIYENSLELKPNSVTSLTYQPMYNNQPGFSTTPPAVALNGGDYSCMQSGISYTNNAQVFFSNATCSYNTTAGTTSNNTATYNNTAMYNNTPAYNTLAYNTPAYSPTPTSYNACTNPQLAISQNPSFVRNGFMNNVNRSNLQDQHNYSPTYPGSSLAHTSPNSVSENASENHITTVTVSSIPPQSLQANQSAPKVLLPPMPKPPQPAQPPTLYVLLPQPSAPRPTAPRSIAPKPDGQQPVPEQPKPTGKKGGRKSTKDNPRKKALAMAKKIANMTDADVIKPLNKDGETYLHAGINDPQVFDVILEAIQKRPELKVLINMTSNTDETPLYHAAKKKSHMMVQKLIECHADPNVLAREKSDNGVDVRMSALHYCASHGQSFNEVLKVLLTSSDISVDALNSQGVTPLQLAITEHNTPERSASNSQQIVNNISNIKILLNANASCEHPDNKNLQTALHKAVEKGSIELVNLILNHCSDRRRNLLDLMDFEGRTPLHTAAQLKIPAADQLLIIEALCQSGARVTCVDKQGKKPRDYLDSSREQALQALQDMSLGFAYTP